MAPLRIVIVMPEAPLPFGNAAGRWFYVLLRGLVQRGHRVTALAACSKWSDAGAARDMFPAPTYDLRCFPMGVDRSLRGKWRTLRRPHSYVFVPAFERELDNLAARGVDVLHLEQIWSGWLGLKRPDCSILNIHYLTNIDLAEPNGTSFGHRIRWGLSRRAERSLLQCFPFIRTLTPRLTSHVRQLSPSSQVWTVPLGLDTSLYRFSGDAHRTGRPTFALIGSFDWGPTYRAGVRLMTNIWPEIKRQLPEARLRIIGRGARGALRDFVGTPDLEVLEDVPDIEPHFRSADVMLYPARQGSGMKVKVLEAFAYGVPVVTTNEGAEGLPVIDGTHAGVCDDDVGLIQRAVNLARQPSRAERMRVAARQLVEQHCSPTSTVDQIEECYGQLLERRAACA